MQRPANGMYEILLQADRTEDMDGLDPKSQYRYTWRREGEMVCCGWWPVVHYVEFHGHIGARERWVPQTARVGFVPQERVAGLPLDLAAPPIVSWFLTIFPGRDNAVLVYPDGLPVPRYQGLPMDFFAQTYKRGISIGATVHASWSWRRVGRRGI